MRKIHLGFGLLSLAIGCSGSSPDSGANLPSDTGTASIDDGAAGDTGGGDDTSVAPSFDTGSVDAGGADASGESSTDDTTLDETSLGETSSDALGDSASDTAPEGSSATTVKTVFVIVMENHSWSTIKASSSATYIKSLLPKASRAEAYVTPPKLHPSEPNYVWLEAGDNLGITDDGEPSANHQATKAHFVSQLETAKISWKAYQEDIDGKSCPLTSGGLYGTKHCPMLFFDDVTNSNDSMSKHCIDHIRPFSELTTDLAGGSGLARYNFITPNLCNDMHGDAPFGTKCNDKNPFGSVDLIKLGDDWLRAVVPKILASAAYKDNGALFLTWDEGDESSFGLGTASDGPIGMIVLSPLAKGGGYSNTTKYNHSSTLKTFERIFSVPYLKGAAASGTSDLEDLFVSGALP